MKYKGHNAKRDENEPDIVATLRANGISVYLLDQPLDLLCGYGGVTVIAEVKMPRNKKGEPKKYTETQEAFLETWRGGHTLLVTVDDALELARDMKLAAQTRA